MKVLWVTNVEMPEVAKKFGRKVVVGGWMNQTSQQISTKDDIELFIACPIDNSPYEDVVIKGIHYFGFKVSTAYNDIKKLFESIKPDCIHIWGTEYKHSYDAVCVAEDKDFLDKVIISIQGLVSVYAKHYNCGLPEKVVRGRTLKERFGRPNLLDAQKAMEKQGKLEIKTLRKVNHCIGRTDWDFACVRQINPRIRYHFCNETLRKGFYESKWVFEKCVKHTIFFSQAHYPIKGLHYLLEAIPIVRSVFPDVMISIVGEDISKIERIRLSSYQQYLLKLIKKYGLNNCIKWLGFLTEEQMIYQYIHANVFVCASGIENSSNSVGEAMLLGVPVVASDVGGIKSLVNHNIEGLLYQETAPYMLADCIIQIFEDEERAKKLGKSAQKRAQLTHDQKKNFEELIYIYEEITSKT